MKKRASSLSRTTRFNTHGMDSRVGCAFGNRTPQSNSRPFFGSRTPHPGRCALQRRCTIVPRRGPIDAWRSTHNRSVLRTPSPANRSSSTPSFRLSLPNSCRKDMKWCGAICVPATVFDLVVFEGCTGEAAAPTPRFRFARDSLHPNRYNSPKR